jgi:hypothetical protein
MWTSSKNLVVKFLVAQFGDQRQPKIDNQILSNDHLKP